MAPDGCLGDCAFPALLPTNRATATQRLGGNRRLQGNSALFRFWHTPCRLSRPVGAVADESFPIGQQKSSGGAPPPWRCRHDTCDEILLASREAVVARRIAPRGGGNLSNPTQVALSPVGPSTPASCHDSGPAGKNPPNCHWRPGGLAIRFPPMDRCLRRLPMAGETKRSETVPHAHRIRPLPRLEHVPPGRRRRIALAPATGPMAPGFPPHRIGGKVGPLPAAVPPLGRRGHAGRQLPRPRLFAICSNR